MSTFLFKHRHDKILVRSTFPNPTMTEAILFLSEYHDQPELRKKIKNRKVEVYAKIRDKSWQPMGIINPVLYEVTLKKHGKL